MVGLGLEVTVKGEVNIPPQLTSFRGYIYIYIYKEHIYNIGRICR